jgi:lysozyme family protein
MLQKALGVTVDGVVGPITIAAAQNHANMAEAVTAYQWGRLDFYARIVQAKPSQSAFIVGWVARIRHLMESAA